MYSLTKLSRPSSDFVNQAMGSGLNRNVYFPVAVAYALASTMPLPTTEPSSLEDYYRNNLGASSLEVLNRINDVLPHDTKKTRDMIQKFYQYRVRAAFPLLIPLAMNPKNGVVDFFGLSTVFCEDTLALIETSNGNLTRLVSGLFNVLKDLADAQVKAAEQWTSDRVDDHVAG